MADTTALLQPLGFGEYEVHAYITLLQRSPLSGYELAKTSGVPRSNIYPVLRKLEERGAGDEVIAVRTHQPPLVRLVSWYIWHRISLGRSCQIHRGRFASLQLAESGPHPQQRI
jgi:hypothetical protein